ncbi:MAG TPA: 2-hydroxyacid dehydrogenase [Candidatus Bathyarchaeia archaeon]|nr:2-hydroxyacid dehydrogenase [Candidatus Bathyarchaeia archaeon]
MPKPNLLITTDVVDKRSIETLSKYARVFSSSGLDEASLIQLLPSIDILLVFFWPSFLTAENLSRMSNLRLVQSILAGVNHIPFAQLDKKVLVCSNAGAYSDEVAEYTWALLLSAAKRIVDFHNSVKTEQWNLKRTLGGKEVSILEERTLGILGYGGIGSAVAQIGKGFSMKIYAFSRKPVREKGVRSFQGDKGLLTVLAESDAVIVSLPLTELTNKIIGAEKLATMKKDAILVNIARGELVDETALYEHLKANPNFRYATDVWWYREGKESLKTTHPFFELPNFIGTPHVSGPSGLATGKPARFAVENVTRYLRGLKPRNIVNPAEYLVTDRQEY